MDGIRRGRRAPLRHLDFLTGRFVLEFGDDRGSARLGLFPESDRTPSAGRFRRNYHHILCERIVDSELMDSLDRYFLVDHSGDESVGGVVACATGHKTRRMMLNPYCVMD